MRLIEQPYMIPDGYLDFPFIYVFDASSLTDGGVYNNIGIQIQNDADFILRHIVGVPLCVDTYQNGGRWSYKNMSGSYANGNASTGIAAADNWTVVPEKVYGKGRQLPFDLYQVLRANNPCSGGSVYLSNIGFCGVKRIPLGAGYPTGKTTYAYYSFAQSYVFPITITAAYSGGAVTTYSQIMDQYDFELQKILISIPGQLGTLQTNDFSITLYDPNNHQMSNLPVLQSWINSGRPTPATSGKYQPCFPVPPVVYPMGSQIKFDVTSLLCAADVPKSYDINFVGQWRIPCSGRTPGY